MFAKTMSLLEPTQPAMRDVWLKRLPAIVFLVIAVCFYLRTTAYIAPNHVQFSTLPLQNLDGSPLSQQATQGKAVILNFWAPWCGPCRAEIPWLQRLQAEHSDLAVIGVEDDPDQYRNAGILAAQSGISYPLVQASDPVRAAFGHVVMLPTTLYISRSGKVLHAVSGVIPEALMTRYAKEAIAAN
jgi:cytochrome c biogenesis protein CcmG/thiol:disulfide interchange protein DsbE